MDWQLIESAPKDGKILLFNENQNIIGVAWWGIHGFWKQAGAVIFHQPTHWMPLPAPPASGGAS